MTLVPQEPPDADLVDRRYLSQFSTETVGLVIRTSTGPLDPDADAVTATMTNEATAEQVFTRACDRLDVGTYATTLASDETSVPGPYRIEFAYTLSGTPDHYVLHFEVGSSAPAYDALPWEMKQVVEQVWIRFADLYDSPLGGPHLQVYLQTHFGRNRIAQLAMQALGRLNIISQPQMTFAPDSFPYGAWGGLLLQATYVEVVKHLRRSYTEIPEVVLGTTISRMDRRDYFARWGELLTEETDDLKAMTDNFKMTYMGLGNVSVLVSGGSYGRYGPTAPIAGGAALARGYYGIKRIW